MQRIEPAAGLAECGLAREVVTSLQRVADRLVAVSTGSKAHADVTAIFEGPSRADKLKGASAIAKDYGVDVYRIDLALVVADEVLETERSLRRILDAAERADGVLFFDDADALIQPATAGDPYPERGAGYLLKQMGRYEGLSIISISEKAKMDPALTRRLRFTISFNGTLC